MTVTGFLCDTHVVLWAAASPDRLSGEVREILLDPAQLVLVSAVSIAEMAIKSALGKLTMPGTPADVAHTLGFGQLPLTWNHANRVSTLQSIHKDPFDRLLIAQAMEDDLTLITADAQVLQYRDVRLQPAT
jgi:PIN domain nuclease of toxin-antitoxin system